MGDVSHIVNATPFVDIVFDGPPSHESGRFVEVEDAQGRGLNFGKWVHREDGYWALRVTLADTTLLVPAPRKTPRSAPVPDDPTSRHEKRVFDQEDRWKCDTFCPYSAALIRRMS